ncbi:helix-turn-helix domain-containing protein [Micromonospora sp. DT31]|uniref:helix-turn-helix domain-containing protein n=1 Tax=Micromonospora sp. DT31 TaxID=3393434 RepID=UPI003CF39583
MDELVPGRSAVVDGHADRLLTGQQLRIAQLVAEGATNREIATRMFLSTRTVDHHLRNIFHRLGIRSRTELARAALNPARRRVRAARRYGRPRRGPSGRTPPRRRPGQSGR